MLILSSNLHSICPTLRSLSSLKFIFVYGLRDVLVSFSFSLLMHIHALLHSGFHLFSFPATEVECSLFFMASGRFNLRRVLESNHSDWWYEVILNTLPWYLAMLATFHVIFFLMCELKVPVKIRFVAVYSVMNSFLMILHPLRPHQETPGDQLLFTWKPLDLVNIKCPSTRLSVDGQGYGSPCCFTWDQTMVEEMKKMATSF